MVGIMALMGRMGRRVRRQADREGDSFHDDDVPNGGLITSAFVNRYRESGVLKHYPQQPHRGCSRGWGSSWWPFGGWCTVRRKQPGEVSGLNENMQ